MTQWYYAEGPGRNAGPLAAHDIVARFHQGVLFLDSMVWREGMAQWQPLRSVAGELGLDATAIRSVPPPLPGAPSAPPPLTRTAVMAEPRGLSRGMIFLIVGAALVVFVIAVLGILAAIALPAYQDYTTRAKLSAPIAAGTALQAPVQQHLLAQGECPDNDAPGFQAPEAYASGYIGQITIGEFDDGTCGLEVQIRGTGNPRLDDHALWFSYETGTRTWTCSSDIDDRLLPMHCRG